MVLAKQKDDAQALNFFIKSVHLFPMNWGCWLEMAGLVSRVEEVSFWAHLPFYTRVQDRI